MHVLKYPRYNEELMKNLPADMLAELITFEDVIPDNLSYFLGENNPIYKKERSLFLEYHMEIVHKMYAARKKWDEIYESDYENFFTYADLEFIEKYPQFKPLLDYIEYCRFNDDHTHEIIREVPIDEYLAELEDE